MCAKVQERGGKEGRGETTGGGGGERGPRGQTQGPEPRGGGEGTAGGRAVPDQQTQEAPPKVTAEQGGLGGTPPFLERPLILPGAGLLSSRGGLEPDASGCLVICSPVCPLPLAGMRHGK